MDFRRTGKASAKPQYQPTEKHQALISKYATQGPVEPDYAPATENISVTHESERALPTEGGEGGYTMTIQYNPQELNEWAHKTCDLATELGYSLHAMHRLILGNTIGGKALMQLYFKLDEDLETTLKLPLFFG